MDVPIKNIRTLLTIFDTNNYVLNTRPYELNIVGVRSNSVIPNSFDDLIYVFWKDSDGDWDGKYFSVTTDAGTFWLKSPMNKLGTSLLKQGQYKDAYAVGLHKGKYKALVQVKPVTAIIDYNRDAILDFTSPKEKTGLFGINIHQAGTSSTEVGKWSAGCQVFQTQKDFNEFMKLVDKDRNLYGNSFTYTLIDERAYNRGFLKKSLYFVLGAIGVLAIYSGYKTYIGKKIF
jgi:hypothetical protein